MDHTLEIGDKPALRNTIKLIKKEYVTEPMGEIEDFIGCTIKSDLTKMTLKIYQQYIITNITQGFNEDMKSIMTFNNLATPHEGIVINQETDTEISYDLHKMHRSGIGLLL